MKAAKDLFAENGYYPASPAFENGVKFRADRMVYVETCPAFGTVLLGDGVDVVGVPEDIVIAAAHLIIERRIVKCES